MIRRLKELFERMDAEDALEDQREHDLALSTAVLLIAVAHAEPGVSSADRDQLAGLLGRHLDLEQAELDELLELASDTFHDSVELQGFTRQLHEHLEAGEKRRVVELLWRVAIADGEVSRFEAQLVDRVARLLYLREAEVAMVRVKVLDELASG